MIAILCPTRGRPEQLKRMVESVYATGSNKNVVYYGFSFGDKVPELMPGVSHVFPDMLPTAQKWNTLAEIAMEFPEHKLFMLGADDMIFETPGWDKALIDHYNGLENKIHVYALQDSRDENGTPHVIATREYIEAMGYFVPPIFLHWFIDTWTVEIAKANGCFTHLRDFTLKHDKPSDKGQPDETFSRIRQWGWHERDKYVAEKCSHFLEFEKTRLSLIMKRGRMPNLIWETQSSDRAT